jgi:uncharacterized protein (DUF433 family)/DNA-binding transcriptional MerR regulator
VFNIDLTAALSGASVSQLARWRTSNLLVPEVSERPVLYSFRDLVALRTFAKLRAEVPLQRIRKGLHTLAEWDLTEHPASYKLTTDGTSVFLRHEDTATDLVKNKGQQFITGLLDVFEPFTNRAGRHVPDFRSPRPLLAVSGRMMGGFPTIRGSAVPYDDVALLLRDGSVPIEHVAHYYPSVSEQAARDAVDFDAEVLSLSKKVAS